MSQGDLANAPLIDTDIPTSDVYLNQQAVYFNSGDLAGGSAGGDLTRKYYVHQSATAMVSMDNVPNSFGVDASQKGIIGVFCSQAYDGSQTLRLAMHKPIPSVKGFTTDWDVIPGVSINIPSGNSNLSFSAAGAVASQRQGQYAYCFMYFARSGIFTDTIQTTVYKVTRDEYVQVAGVTGGQQVLTGSNSTSATLPLLNVANAGQFFVSDEEEPFIWNVSGSVSLGGQALMTGFRDDNSGNIGYSLPNGSFGTAYYGQAAAYLQAVNLPAGMHGFGPYIVHPWSSGNYAPPELWYFINEFDESGWNTTGRFLVYRARWKKGAYVKPVGVQFADDPDFEANLTSFPKLNPLGYGWETKIFDDAHLVGIVGPFNGISVYNPKGDAFAALQNSTSVHGSPVGAPASYDFTGSNKTVLPFAFKVVRDKKRFGSLHIIAIDGGVYPNDGTLLNRVWYSNSADDGKTWTRMSQISPAIQPATQGTAAVVANLPTSAAVQRTGIPTSAGLQTSEMVSYNNWSNGAVAMPSIVRTHDDVLLMGNLSRYTGYTFGDGSTPPYYSLPGDAGSKVALAIIDYTGSGTGAYNPNTVVFVQQSTRGGISWQ